MAEDAAKTPSPFDVRTIKYLVGLMSQHDLSEIDLREGELRIRLRRGAREIVVAPPSAPPPTAPPPASPPASPAAAPPADAASSVHHIKSPTPGTFYSAPSPDAEPFVRVGARVTPSTVVCVIEAMKIFNEITADCTGIIKEILVENQQPVEFGQALFKVDLTA
ncbi:MAG TPA: acetyl-CoA carboxylase biotin carboxyl carrier protein [Gemmataceae bacterium]|nr:acetyl-CoA carboxylase biotin carboxyl carrier protein [Gemmataceae bacterium]